MVSLAEPPASDLRGCSFKNHEAIPAPLAGRLERPIRQAGYPNWPSDNNARPKEVLDLILNGGHFTPRESGFGQSRDR